MSEISDDFNNPQKIRQWFLGIHVIFKHIQKKNNWSKQEAWDELKIELIHEVGGVGNFSPDDLDWIKSLLIDDKLPTTQECLRVAQRYPNTTPLLDSLKKFI